MHSAIQLCSAQSSQVFSEIKGENLLPADDFSKKIKLSNRINLQWGGQLRGMVPQPLP